jgi:hypothetical protein
MECSTVTGAKPMRSIYGAKYDWSALVRHPAFIYIPYNSSSMSFLEQYSMNVPLFVPTKEFLLELALKYGALLEISWNLYFGLPSGSCVKGVRQDLPDPNDHFNLEGIKLWMSFYDFYRFPHVQQFSSFVDLKRKLETTDMASVSRLMADHNRARKAEIKADWAKALQEFWRG